MFVLARFRLVVAPRVVCPGVATSGPSATRAAWARHMSIMSQIRQLREQQQKAHEEVAKKAQNDFFAQIQAGTPLRKLLPDVPPPKPVSLAGQRAQLLSAVSATGGEDTDAAASGGDPSPAAVRSMDATTTGAAPKPKKPGYPVDANGDPLYPRLLTVAVVGAPNAGKSTLVNDLVGTKVSIVSSKVQTTRQRVAGVLTEGDAQVVFYDTPGISPRGYNSKTLKPLTDAAWKAVEAADVVLLVVDAAHRLSDNVLDIARGAEAHTKRKAAAAASQPPPVAAASATARNGTPKRSTTHGGRKATKQDKEQEAQDEQEEEDELAKVDERAEVDGATAAPTPNIVEKLTALGRAALEAAQAGRPGSHLGPAQAAAVRAAEEAELQRLGLTWADLELDSGDEAGDAGARAPRRMGEEERALWQAAAARDAADEAMLAAAERAEAEAAAAGDRDPWTELLADGVAQQTLSAPVLVLNKVDLVKRKPRLLPLAAQLNDVVPFADTFMVSALEHDGTDRLRAYLLRRATPRPWLFARDEVTDQSDLKRTEEIIREKVYQRLNQELPYQVQQRTDSWTLFRDGSLRIDHTLIVAAESHKPILIGKGAQVLKQIGIASRLEIEQLVGRRVHLVLNVSVRD